MARTTEPDLPLWVYLIGVAAIAFVIYVWRAPIDWITDLIADRMQDSVKELQTPTTTQP